MSEFNASFRGSNQISNLILIFSDFILSNLSNSSYDAQSPAENFDIVAERLDGIERILIEIANRAEETRSFNAKNIERIERKIEKIFAVVCEQEKDREQEDLEDRKRLKERLKEAAIEHSSRNKKTVNTAEKESWAEFFFGICKPDGRIGKEGSRFTKFLPKPLSFWICSDHPFFLQTYTPAISLHARFFHTFFLTVARANIKWTCLHIFCTLHSLCTQPGILFCSAALLLYTAVIVPVQICLWSYDDPCTTFPTLHFDIVVDAFFMVE